MKSCLSLCTPLVLLSCVMFDDGGPRFIPLGELTDAQYDLLTGDLEFISELGTRRLLAAKPELAPRARDIIERGLALASEGGVAFAEFVSTFEDRIEDPDAKAIFRLAISRLEAHGGFDFVEDGLALSERSVGIARAMLLGARRAAFGEEDA